MRIPTILPPTGLILATALLLCLGGTAIATETAVHNDMDGDGRSDLIWQHDSTGAIVYWSAANSRLWSRAKIENSYDFDMQRLLVRGTGNYIDEVPRVDLMLQDRYSEFLYGMYSLYPNMGYRVVPDYFGGSPQDSIMFWSGDFDGDGISDPFVRNLRSGENFVRFSTTWGWWDLGDYAPIATVSNLAWQVAGIGDFDGDSYSDILWRNVVTGANTIWRSANAQTRIRMTSVTNLDWRIVGIGDFDGDGRSDIFWRNASTGVNGIWKSGNYATRQAVTRVSNQQWKVASVADFNGDGKSDVFWRNSVTGANVIWRSANSATVQRVRYVTDLAWGAVP